MDLKHRSRALTEGPERAAARAYLKGIGYDDEALSKPIIGVASTWIETMPCNFHLRALSARVKDGIRDAGGTPMEYNTVAISDGITMGTRGMRTSLVSREDLAEIEAVASPGAGACGGQFTANTMAMAFEVMGISPFASAMVAAQDARKADVAYEAGRLAVDVLKRGISAREIITRESIENAITAVAMSGGSTNAVLHLLAIAREAGVPLDIRDFDEISERTPLLCDLQPGGRYLATHLGAAG